MRTQETEEYHKYLQLPIFPCYLPSATWVDASLLRNPIRLFSWWCITRTGEGNVLWNPKWDPFRCAAILASRSPIHPEVRGFAKWMCLTAMPRVMWPGGNLIFNDLGSATASSVGSVFVFVGTVSLFEGFWLADWLYHCFVASDWLTVSLLGNLWQCGSDYLICLLFKNGNPTENTQKTFVLVEEGCGKFRKKLHKCQRYHMYSGNFYYYNICLISFYTNFQWMSLYDENGDSDESSGLSSMKITQHKILSIFILFWTVEKFFSKKTDLNFLIC